MRPAASERQNVRRVRERTFDARDLVPVRRGLGALYRSDDGVTLNALAASAWRDLGTGAADVAQGTGSSQPTVVPLAAGAHTALRFDGSNDQVSRTIATAVKPSARGLSVVFVAQGRSGSTGDYPAVVSARPWVSAGDEGFAISCNGSGSSGVLTAHYAASGVGFDHTDCLATRGLSTTQREMWAVVFDDVANRARFFRNGQLDVERSPTFPSATPDPVSDFRIGMDRAVGTGTRILAVDLYALAIHSEPLTAREVATYWSRWGSIYGVTP